MNRLKKIRKLKSDAKRNLLDARANVNKLEKLLASAKDGVKQAEKNYIMIENLENEVKSLPGGAAT